MYPIVYPVCIVIYVLYLGLTIHVFHSVSFVDSNVSDVMYIQPNRIRLYLHCIHLGIRVVHVFAPVSMLYYMRSRVSCMYRVCIGQNVSRICVVDVSMYVS